MNGITARVFSRIAVHLDGKTTETYEHLDEIQVREAIEVLSEIGFDDG